MAIYIPDVAASVIADAVQKRNIFGRLVSDYSDMVDLTSGKKIVFPVIDDISVETSPFGFGDAEELTFKAVSTQDKEANIITLFNGFFLTDKQMVQVKGDLQGQSLLKLAKAISDQADRAMAKEICDNALITASTSSLCIGDIYGLMDSFPTKNRADFSGFVFSGHLHSKLLGLADFVSAERTNMGVANGVCDAELIGYINGIPCYTSESPELYYTSGGHRYAKVILLGKDACVCAWQKGVTYEEERSLAKLRTNFGASCFFATKMISGNRAGVITVDLGAVASTPTAKLSALSIGSLTLSPAFDADTTTYTASTTNTTNTITATAAEAGATVAILNGSTAVTSGSAATWSAGENTVTVTVTSGSVTKTYTITVTKGE